MIAFWCCSASSGAHTWSVVAIGEGGKKSQSGGWVQAQWRGCGRQELQRGEPGLPLKNVSVGGSTSRGSSLNPPVFGDPPS